MKLDVTVSVQLTPRQKQILEEMRWEHVDVLAILQTELAEYLVAWISGLEVK